MPFFEQILRWIDIFTFFDYPEEIKNKASDVAFSSKYLQLVPRGKPSVLAAACLYIADNKSWSKKHHSWKYEKINKLVMAKNMKPISPSLRSYKKLVISPNSNILLKTIIETGDLIEGNK